MPRFSANLSTLFIDAPFPARFARAAKAGFSAVEFQSPYDHPAEKVAALLRDNGLTCVMFNMPAGRPGERGIAAVPGRELDFRDAVERAVEYALATGASGLHAMAGVVTGPIGDHAHTYAANLRHAARRLAMHGLTLLIEPISAASIAGYFLTGMSQAAGICAAVDAPNLGIQMDFYHTHMTEGGLAARFLEHGPRIRHIQISNAPGRAEPDAGEIDYARIFKMIDESGYEGWVGCEYTPRGLTEDGLGWMRTLVA